MTYVLKDSRNLIKDIIFFSHPLFSSICRCFSLVCTGSLVAPKYSTFSSLFAHKVLRPKPIIHRKIQSLFPSEFTWKRTSLSRGKNHITKPENKTKQKQENENKI